MNENGQPVYEDEYQPKVRSTIEFTDKIVEPDMAIVRKLEKTFGEEKAAVLIENLKLIYNTITRDYLLANLDKPSNKNRYDVSSFCHNEKAVMLLSGRPHLALAFDVIMKGDLLLSRSIGMKQQELFHTDYLKKEVTEQAPKKGLIPTIRR